jgi:hypothetical protein
LNLGQDSRELKTRHSLKLSWWRSFFLRPLTSWVMSVLPGADHSPCLDVHRDHDCVELVERLSWDSLLLQHSHQSILLCLIENMWNLIVHNCLLNHRCTWICRIKDL